MDDIAGLIERLERATGHDDALNFDIAVSQGWKPHQAIIDGEAFTAKWTTPSGDTRIICPWFTTSIDAALTLIPDWSWRVGNLPSGRGFADLGALQSMQCIEGATPAIALCIAALKARVAVSVTPL